MNTAIGQEKGCTISQIQTQIKELLTQLQPPDGLKQLIWLALEQPGQILAENGGGKTKLINAVCHSLGGDSSLRLTELATAFELLIPAFDVIDDIQDGKLWEGVERVEMGCWLNVALYLLHLGQQVLSKCGYEPSVLLKAQALLNARVLEAVSGQNADLLSEDSCINSQAALKISALKSGALMQAIFEFCAIIVGTSAEIVEIAGKIGQLLGIHRQLGNDFEDLLPDYLAGTCDLEKMRIIRNNDIGRRKKTVPVTFALNFAQSYPSEKNAFFREYYEKAEAFPLNPDEYRLLCETIRNSGAFAYVQVLREMYAKEAQRLISQLEEAGYTKALNLAELFKM